MPALAVEWLELAARWLHVVAGVVWIGTSFYFTGLDLGLREPEESDPDLEGELWEVHGGGFYRVSKYDVAPPRMPQELQWFKWEAYTTWLSGAALLVLVYYLGADAYLLGRDATIGATAGIAIAAGAVVGGWLAYEAVCRTPIVERPGTLAAIGLVAATAAAFLLSQVLSGRAAYIHVGAAIGTMMAANVFFVIIPAHRDLVDAVEEGREPDAARARDASRRSRHNNYLTLPVLFLMISNHYPVAYEHPQGWLILGALAALGGWIRHYFNLRHRGRDRPWILATAAIGFVAVALFAARGTGRGGPSGDLAGAGAGGDEAVAFEEVRAVIASRCATCHSADPVDELFDAPPAGIAFDTPEQIRSRAGKIYEVTVASRVMPLGNLTDMTEEERALVGRWARRVEAGR
ncbi:MAG: urate hydroxylase PuuD [Gemmatimonadota bacterium]|nr:urate hydroxylase PuuD [Gemmatimonadota bacterium]